MNNSLFIWMAIFITAGILGGMLASLGWPAEAAMVAGVAVLLGLLIGQLLEM